MSRNTIYLIPNVSMEVLYVKIACQLIFLLTSIYAIYRVVKWAINLKITVKVNHLHCDPDDRFVKWGGGPLVDRSTGQEPDSDDCQTRRKISINDDGIYFEQLPDPDPTYYFGYDQICFLIETARDFRRNGNLVSEIHTLRELKIVAQSLISNRDGELIQESAYETIKELFENYPQRPTPEQPK